MDEVTLEFPWETKVLFEAKTWHRIGSADLACKAEVELWGGENKCLSGSFSMRPLTCTDSLNFDLDGNTKAESREQVKKAREFIDELTKWVDAYEDNLSRLTEKNEEDK
jgi:hypothetical protein